MFEADKLKKADWSLERNKDFLNGKEYVCGEEKRSIGSIIKTGLICIILALVLASIFPLLGLLPIVALVFFVMSKQDVTRKETVEEYLRDIDKHVEENKNRALEALGVDEDEVNEIAPIHIGGFDFDKATLFRKDIGDSITTTDRYDSVSLFFSANEVHCYRWNFSTIDNRKETVSTEVYFYNDIVSMSTENAEFEGNDLIKDKISYQKFVLRTAGGTAFSVITSNSASVQRSINAMRQLLRQKKAR